MEIKKVETDKKRYMGLLLLADEQEDMVDRYLERGTMYVLEDDGVKAECVVTDEGDGILELKNLAVEPDFQGRGYGKAMVDFLVRTYKEQYTVLQVGTGDSPSTIPFYESCGFRRHHLVKYFFTDNYDHPIYECGVQLVDMVYLQKEL
jgi:ribosomal protein S18 acetylase RimI-like enzyme